MRLPVIQTCGECAFCHTTSVCMHPRAHPVYEIDGFAKPPPSWCPLRTGPDTDRTAALEAVASSANALAEAWKTEESEPTSVVLDRVQSAEDVLIAALRSLT